MKRIFLFFVTLLISLSIFAQDNKSADFTGLYQIDFYPSRKLKVAWENNGFTLEIVGQGKTMLEPLRDNSFAVKGIPNSTIEFIRDDLGKTIQFVWNHQPFQFIWSRISGPANSFDSTTKNTDPFSGKYSVNGKGYQVINIHVDSDRLVSQAPGETSVTYYPTTKNNFIFKYGDYNSIYEFLPDKKGKITRFRSTETGPFHCNKIMDSAEGGKKYKHNLAQRTGFTLADTLQGTLSPLRSCYDVLFYDLEVAVDPDTKSIQGSTGIRFRAVEDFSALQVDLFACMKIEKILFNNEALSFTRNYDAVLIQFPQTMRKNAVGEIKIIYSGTPQIPDMSTLSGGFIWAQDKNGKPWIEVVSQGAGASLWWPCKDHLSDKPDSMHINVTIPSGLTAIANGQLIGKTEMPDKKTRFQWAVHYPINTYNAVLYIGDYVHFSDTYNHDGIQFPLNYYCLSYNLDITKKFVRHVKPMHRLYQKEFGVYPFLLDGYALVESPYGMEHQSAVSIGIFSNPRNDQPMDTADMERTLWHESAHEWWGNSVTCSDYADFWIHESFASYAEVLCYEYFYGETISDKYLLDQPVSNKEPIIGYYGVNDFHMGDMYTKGTRMIATLRCVIHNDSLFFDMLRGLQKHFAYQSVNTNDIIQFINVATATDYTYFFDQYLKYAAIPKLYLTLKQSGNDLDIRYQWKADVADFRLPVKVSASGKEPFFIYPTSEVKTLHLPSTLAKDFHPDQIHEYFNLKVE